MVDAPIKLSVILPTFNEAANIATLIDRLNNILKPLDFPFEIIVIDDNSTDGTGKAIQKNFPNIHLVVRTTEAGLASAIRRGIEEAQGEFCVWMDSDLSMPPNLIPYFLKHLDEGADFVLGSRYCKGGGMKGSAGKGNPQIFGKLWGSHDSLISALLSVAGNKAVSILGRGKIHDFTSGFYAGKRELLLKLPIQGGPIDYCIRLSHTALKRGLLIVEVPMVMGVRITGKSKTSSTLWAITKNSIRCIITTINMVFTKEGET